MEQWAISHSINRIELTVLSHNVRALSLYKKMGFEVEGTKKNSLFIDGTYADGYYMAKILGQP
ncbi:hypothetical protein CVD28_14935 [Bacillus sp. M6-12]|nr:hypothetical protein CVD28_14935 [Bacillus sp. M6-12]